MEERAREYDGRRYWEVFTFRLDVAAGTKPMKAMMTAGTKAM